MREKKGRPKNKYTLKQRFQYWFDSHMTKGAIGIVMTFIAVTILIAIFMGILIINLGFVEETRYEATIWDSITHVINTDMPLFDDGSLGYLCLMTVSALLGLLFTSVLIGTITNAIEVKLEALRNGNSLVIEKNHIVVLGFYPGEYTLLRQLILSADGKPACVVVAEDIVRTEMEECIDNNLKVPDNFRIVCRTADITDPASLAKCSIDTCKTVIVSPTDDIRTIKAVLAASKVLKKRNVEGIRVNALIKGEYTFPPSIAEANNISTLPTNYIMATMIAHSCTQNGLSETFKQIFDFNGSEFYLITLPGISGLSFEEVMFRVDGGIPAGVCRNNSITLNPPASFIFEDGDLLLVFSEEKDSASLGNVEMKPLSIPEIPVAAAEDSTNTVIIGHNESLPVILRELPENVSHVYLAGWDPAEKEHEDLEKIASARNLSLTYYSGDLNSESVLLDLAHIAEHIVILNGHDFNDDSVQDADMESIITLLNLRDIRTRYNLDFNITVEMMNEHDQGLVDVDDHTDFLVSSSISSLILAQLSESPHLIEVFQELLTNIGEYSFRTLRRLMLRNGYILLGYLDADKRSFFNCPSDQMITLAEKDELILIGKY